MGGGFGGKPEPIGCDSGALLLSRKTGHPVKIVYSQEKVFLPCRWRRLQLRVKVETHEVAVSGHFSFTSLVREPPTSYRGHKSACVRGWKAL